MSSSHLAHNSKTRNAQAQPSSRTKGRFVALSKRDQHRDQLSGRGDGSARHAVEVRDGVEDACLAHRATRAQLQHLPKHARVRPAEAGATAELAPQGCEGEGRKGHVEVGPKHHVVRPLSLLLLLACDLQPPLHPPHDAVEGQSGAHEGHAQGAAAPGLAGAFAERHQAGAAHNGGRLGYLPQAEALPADDQRADHHRYHLRRLRQGGDGEGEPGGQRRAEAVLGHDLPEAGAEEELLGQALLGTLEQPADAGEQHIRRSVDQLQEPDGIELLARRRPVLKDAFLQLPVLDEEEVDACGALEQLEALRGRQPPLAPLLRAIRDWLGHR
mmetsp:Transcript_158097/g.507254  ORF Transcript_158097/g.507254 Transcript_158097/m.507254 type:complete len:328 (+) Transcript_158097:451-1434(+)